MDSICSRCQRQSLCLLWTAYEGTAIVATVRAPTVEQAHSLLSEVLFGGGELAGPSSCGVLGIVDPFQWEIALRTGPQYLKTLTYSLIGRSFSRPSSSS